MIYEIIPEKISSFLKEKFNLSDSQILLDGQIPDDDVDVFVRLFWNYGIIKEYNNRYSETADVFIIELYQKRTSSIQDNGDFAASLRSELFKNFNVIRDVNTMAKLRNISLNKNDNDTAWKGYSISLSFQMLNRRFPNE